MQSIFDFFLKFESFFVSTFLPPLSFRFFWYNISFHLPTNSSLFVYVKQLENCAKKSFDGWEGTTTNLPIASASATVVHNTSDVDGLTNIFHQTKKIERGKRRRKNCKST